ncbi:MAG: hypothetical protein AB7J46_01940 [Candidatus Altimarinota bacterium]
MRFTEQFLGLIDLDGRVIGEVDPAGDALSGDGRVEVKEGTAIVDGVSIECLKKALDGHPIRTSFDPGNIHEPLDKSIAEMSADEFDRGIRIDFPVAGVDFPKGVRIDFLYQLPALELGNQFRI